jgi:hypothetical protein
MEYLYDFRVLVRMKAVVRDSSGIFFFSKRDGDDRSQTLTEALLGRMATYMLPVQGVG